MGIEIERKFLVDAKKVNPWLKDLPWIDIEQYYITNKPSMRVRKSRTSGKITTYTLTIKGEGFIERTEDEWEISEKAFKRLKKASVSKLKKRRYLYTFGEDIWEVDKIDIGDGDIFWMAELELKSADQEFSKPNFLTKEVSEDKRYSNAYIAKHKHDTLYSYGDINEFYKNFNPTVVDNSGW